MKRKPSIVAYDIHRNQTRRRIHQILLQWRLDGQKSVHECLLTEVEAQELFIQLGEILDPATDRLLLAWLSPRQTVYTRGNASVDRLFSQVIQIH